MSKRKQGFRRPRGINRRLIEHIEDHPLSERGEVRDRNDPYELRVERHNTAVDRALKGIAEKEVELLDGLPPSHVDPVRLREHAIEALTPPLSDEEWNLLVMKIMYDGSPSPNCAPCHRRRVSRA